MRVGKTAVAIVATLTVVATSALAASGATVAPLKTVSGKSPYAKCDTGSVVDDFTYTNADTDPRVASSPADPDDLVGVWTQDASIFGDGHGVMSSWSSDGGATWHGARVPFTTCNTPATRFTSAQGPWVSIGADGRVYATALMHDDSGNGSVTAAAVSVSNDKGHTWGTPSFIGTTSVDDANLEFRTAVAASPTVAGTAYLVIDRVHLRFPNITFSTLFSKTTDGGAHWSKLKAVPAGSNTVFSGHTIVSDPSSGAVYLVWTEFDARRGIVARLVVSPDGGSTWSGRG